MTEQLLIRTFRISVATCMVLLGFVASVRSQVYIGGDVTANTTYSPANNPYIVTQNLIVQPNVTLTILPGVEILFESGTSLINNGILVAKGTTGEKIKFLPKNTSSFPGQWTGIVFNNSKTLLDADSVYVSGSVISDAIISNASYSLTLSGNSSLLVENTLITLCSFGVYIKDATDNIIRNSIITNCDFGIFLASGYQNGRNKIYSNRIVGSSDVGIFINSTAQQSNHNYLAGNLISGCSIGIHMGNYSNNGEANNTISGNLFTGNKDAVKLFQHSNTVENNYFLLNRSGVICWQSDYNTIKNNLFSRNVLFGITLAAGSSFNSVTYNSMNYNSGGVWIKPDSLRSSLYNSFLYNTIYNNTDFSFQIVNTPQGPVQFNNIGHNGDFLSFRNLADSTVHAEYNFWADTSESRIDSIISDVYDDASKGEVLYKPILENILSTPPVPPPYNVIKQKIGDDLVVSWEGLELTDLGGYNIYTGNAAGSSYEHLAHNGMSTMVNLGDFPVYDTIAVTATDFLADGNNDQTDGYESDYAFAQLAPYAGPDTALCYNSEYLINLATAPGYESLIWSTSGDGTFSNTHILGPLYSPGPQDFLNGYVFLFLQSIAGESQHIDLAKLTFHDAPAVFAGNDTIISTDSTLWLRDASAVGFLTLKWTSSGDGTFDSDILANPVYDPGPEDINSGQVILSFTALSACGSATDQISVSFDAGYFIKGRIHTGNLLAPNSSLSLFQLKNDIIQPVRSGLITTDGNFEIRSLFSGVYYLYAVPDKTAAPGYLPTYFFNDVHWENAHKIDLTADTYDVDIDLSRISTTLPNGEGSIFGVCTSAPGTSESCGDVTVLLFDRQMKNILDWTLVHNGNGFRFKNLPFGEYMLAGEKTGMPFFTSGLIQITPSQPKIENIELVCTSSGYKFTGPGQSGTSDDAIAINIYPNPVSNGIYITGAGDVSDARICIYNSQGLMCKLESGQNLTKEKYVDLSALPAGVYLVELWNNKTCLLRRKLLKI